MFTDLFLFRRIIGATYPTDPNLPAVTNATAVDPTWGNSIVDNLEAIADDLRAAWGDDDAWNGTPNTAGQAANIEQLLENMRAQIKALSGGANWYTAPSCNLADLYTRFVELHPEYPGAVETLKLRGAAASGANTYTLTTDEDVASNVARHYYEMSSAETSLQCGYIAVRFTLPDIFDAWAASNALQIEFQTESGTSINCHVDINIYQSGDATEVANSLNNANTSWTTVTIDDSTLNSAHSWAAGDVIEIYLKMETRNDYFARVGKIRLNFTV